MKRLYSLKGRRGFQELFKSGYRFRTKGMLFYILSVQESDVPKIGFSFERRFGKAFERNHTKRMARSIVRGMISGMKKDCHVLIRFYEVSKGMSYQEIERLIRFALKKNGVFDECPIQEKQ